MTTIIVVFFFVMLDPLIISVITSHRNVLEGVLFFHMLIIKQVPESVSRDVLESMMLMELLMDFLIAMETITLNDVLDIAKNQQLMLTGNSIYVYPGVWATTKISGRQPLQTSSPCDV